MQSSFIYLNIRQQIKNNRGLLLAVAFLWILSLVFNSELGSVLPLFFLMSAGDGADAGVGTGVLGIGFAGCANGFGSALGAAEGVGTSTSTPFLLTWNGQKYQHENDFLFGKPNTAFSDQATGLNKYELGVGGDTYILQNQLTADNNSQLRLQIREIEPEESFIDRLAFYSVDLKPTEHLIVDGNLEDSYVFDEKEISVSKQKLIHFNNQQNHFKQETNTYQSLKPQAGKDITLQTNDELVIQIEKENLATTGDHFILVDSHYRDWSLGGQVPFSALEKFKISSMAFGRSVFVTSVGVAVALAAVNMSTADQNMLKKIVSLPYAHADTPHYSESGYSSQSGYSWGGKGGDGDDNRSLVVSVGDDTKQTYLQTLFPRYVQSSQEVVRIPQEIIKSIKSDFLSVRIKATKKHKVRAAFVFTGKAKQAKLTELKTTRAFHQRENIDYAQKIENKDSEFLHTLPGDVVDLVVKDSPKVTGTVRRYVVKTNGFYTKLSPVAKRKIGTNWLNRLKTEDRRLLQRLKLT